MVVCYHFEMIHQLMSFAADGAAHLIVLHLRFQTGIKGSAALRRALGFAMEMIISLLTPPDGGRTTL